MEENILNIILDKINKEGEDSLTFDERIFLKQHGEGSVNPELVDWLLDEDDSYDNFGDKLQYYVFNRDELNPYQNIERTVNIINYNMGFDGEEHSDSDWGDSYVWLLKGDESSGIFLVYDVETPEIAIVKRTVDDDMGVYNNTDMETSRTVKTFYGLIENAKKIKNNMENNKKSRIYEMIMKENNMFGKNNQHIVFFKDGKPFGAYENMLSTYHPEVIKDWYEFLSQKYGVTYKLYSYNEFVNMHEYNHIQEFSGLPELFYYVMKNYDML